MLTTFIFKLKTNSLIVCPHHRHHRHAKHYICGITSRTYTQEYTDVNVRVGYPLKRINILNIELAIKTTRNNFT